MKLYLAPIFSFLFLFSVLISCSKDDEKVSDDDRLSEIIVDSTSLADFHADTLYYNYNMPLHYDFPIVKGIPVDPSASIVITYPPEIPGVVELEVTSESRLNSRKYTVNFVDYYKWSGAAYHVPGQDVFYDLKVDKCDKLNIKTLAHICWAHAVWVMTRNLRSSTNFIARTT